MKVLFCFFFIYNGCLLTVAQSVKASSFGFNADDATLVFSKAVASTFDTIIVDKQQSDWVTGPLHFDKIKNKTIIFEKGVVLKAKKGAFTNKNSCLLQFKNSENIKLIGNETLFVMNKYEYTDGEWRHALSLRNAKNIAISGLILKDSGGDGIYIAGTEKGTFCENIFIENSKAINNKRQGISVISVKGLKVKSCVFSDTNGTPPSAGIDLEPNWEEDALMEIIFENCKIENNHGAGIKVAAHKLTSISQPIDVSFINCELSMNCSPEKSVPRAEIILGAHKTNPVKGHILFEKCTVRQSNWGLLSSRKPGNAFSVEFKDCKILNTSKKGTDPLVYLEVPDYQAASTLGGFNFKNMYVETANNLPVFVVRGSRAGTLKSLHDITGNILVKGIKKPLFEYINYSSSLNKNVSLSLKTVD